MPGTIGAWVAALGSSVLSCSVNFMRIGVATPSPKAIASRFPMAERNVIWLAEESEIDARMISWSRSLPSRMANTVEHCERIVGSSSPGRCVTTPM